MSYTSKPQYYLEYRYVITLIFWIVPLGLWPEISGLTAYHMRCTPGTGCVWLLLTLWCLHVQFLICVCAPLWSLCVCSLVIAVCAPLWSLCVCSLVIAVVHPCDRCVCTLVIVVCAPLWSLCAHPCDRCVCILVIVVCAPLWSLCVHPCDLCVCLYILQQSCTSESWQVPHPTLRDVVDRLRTKVGNPHNQWTNFSLVLVLVVHIISSVMYFTHVHFFLFFKCRNLCDIPGTLHFLSNLLGC